MLDNLLIKEFTKENYKLILQELAEKKTDSYLQQVHIPMGVDGNTFATITSNINQFASTFCKRALNGSYVFSAFREIQIPKAPFSSFEFKLAKSKNKLRTLSISTINDTIFQKMIYNAIYPYTEKKYKILDGNIFGYRKGKSVKQAITTIQHYICEGYKYGIDGDIKSYFDEINHNKLKIKLDKFYKNNKLVCKYLYRFFKTKKVPIANKKSCKFYYTHKPKTEPRNIGIPQGGVLSGLLANIYLYNFDKYIIKNLSKRYDIKYVRYADDFIVLCKDKSLILSIYKKLQSYLKRELLILHPLQTDDTNDKSKTKVIDFDKHTFIEFLGFKIHKNYLAVKKDNIEKFKKIIRHIVDNGIKNKNAKPENIMFKINAKILGNFIFAKGHFISCINCNKPQKPQSWIGFFININDMRQLKSLDRWIRSEIRRLWWEKYGIRLDKKYFTKEFVCRRKDYYKNNLASLFKEACLIKNYFKEHPDMEFCSCNEYEPFDISFIS